MLYPAIHFSKRTTTCLSALAALLLATSSTFATTVSCNDLDYLTAQSPTGFAAMINQHQTEEGNFETSVQLEGASHCTVIEDPAKRSYRCTWSFPYADQSAENFYQSLSKEIWACISSTASVSKDQLVNHPDTYKANIYSHANTEVRVIFKHKRALQSTFVSMMVEGMETHSQ